LRVGDLLKGDFEELFDKELKFQEGLTQLMKGQNPEELREKINQALQAGDDPSLIDRLTEIALGKYEVHYDRKQILDDLQRAKDTIGPLITDVMPVIWEAHNNGKRVLGEAGQGVLLDLDRGSYPDVTSSHPGIAGFNLATGISPREVRRVIAVTKAYATRVGSGPLPTELTDETGEYIRKTGNEYGGTTGRPRRTGWLDLVAVKYGLKVGGADSLALTKLDILDKLPSVSICVGYRAGGREYREIPSARIDLLRSAEPIYETLPGWEKDTTGARSFKVLPKNAQALVQRVQEVAGVPVEFVSVGPERAASIYM
jgi:adenylosuccinate synthase